MTPDTTQAPEKNPGGRPTLLTDEVRDRIVAAIRGGATLKAAAEANHLGYRTLHEWLERGEDRSDRPSTEAYEKFAQMIRAAEGDFETEVVRQIRESANDREIDFRPLTWLLERRFPERWGNRGTTKVQQEISGPEGKPITGVVVLPAIEALPSAPSTGALAPSHRRGPRVRTSRHCPAFARG